MKIAKFHSTEHNFDCYREWCFWTPDGEYPPDGDYVRITEWVDVEFPPLPPEVTIPAQVAALDKAAEEVRAKAENALQNIERRKQELMALPAPVSA